MSSLPSVDDYRLNDSQRNLRASLIICLTVSAVFVLLRALVRLHIQRQFALDDYLLLLALVSCLGQPRLQANMGSCYTVRLLHDDCLHGPCH